MKIVGGRERCSCGSGKKYKHCCQDKKTVGISQHMGAELLELKQDFLQFSIDNFQEQIDECIDDFLEDVLFEDDETFNQAGSLLMVWIIFSLPMAENNQTILQMYIEKYGKKINRQALQEALHSWDGLAPSIYKVLNDNNGFLYVEDIFTLEKKQIDRIGLKEAFISEQSLEECYIIGTVIDYNNRLLFFATFQVIEDDSKIEDILAIYELYKNQFDFSPQDFTNEVFPKIIKVIYNEPLTTLFDSDEIQWDTEQQKQVIELVRENLKLPKEVQTMIEALSATLWKSYCLKTGGNIRGVPKYAAALHYIISYFYLFFGEDELSDHEVAKLYGVKIRTLTDTIKKLDNVLEEDIDNMIDDLEFDFDDDDEDEFGFDFLFGDDALGGEELDTVETIDLSAEVDDDILKKSKHSPVQVVDELAKKRQEKQRKKFPKK